MRLLPVLGCELVILQFIVTRCLYLWRIYHINITRVGGQWPENITPDFSNFKGPEVLIQRHLMHAYYEIDHSWQKPGIRLREIRVFAE
ncbi:hypothetical protein DEU56DRAFT_831076 [Suillus clintonianus]|uniref:uncharacterized protein n=1 Tax=Suillus clintonianus TaxID=1904413 RepID=UPI001B865882|nr:uncharacterized protein DEU56DRAFT_831076 [Suillus clintonianus]KAG2122924.1 hypothetical protein DEU56DRAFT_831076 [Suillus clintonianus]